MSNEDKNIEVEVIDENDDTQLVDESTTDSGDQTGSEEDNSLGEEKRNVSNFKKLSKAKKEAEKNLADERKRREEAERRLALLSGEDETLEDEDSPQPSVSNDSDLEKRLFFIENPEAKEYAEEIENELLETPGMTLDKALLIAKANNPTSTSKEDIPTGQPRRKVRKKISELSEQESLSLSNTDYIKYLRSQGADV